VTTERTLVRRTLPAALAAFAATAALAVSPVMAAGDDGRDIAEVAAPDAGQAQVVVALKAGQAYRVEAICCSYGGYGSGDGVRVLDPAGNQVAFTENLCDETCATGFVALYSAEYRLVIDYGDGYARLWTDCLGGGATICTIGPNNPASGYTSDWGDTDAYRTTLQKGRTYRWTYPAGLYVELQDAGSHPLKKNHTGSMSFRPTKAGTYFLAVKPSGTTYRVTMR
jgi:hypothetical protein